MKKTTPYDANPSDKYRVTFGVRKCKWCGQAFTALHPMQEYHQPRCRADMSNYTRRLAREFPSSMPKEVKYSGSVPVIEMKDSNSVDDNLKLWIKIVLFSIWFYTMVYLVLILSFYA